MFLNFRMVYILPRPALQFISRSFYKKAYPTYFAFIAVVAAGIEWVYCPWVEGALNIPTFQETCFRPICQQLEPGPHASPHPPRNPQETGRARSRRGRRRRGWGRRVNLPALFIHRFLQNIPQWKYVELNYLFAFGRIQCSLLFALSKAELSD